MKLRQLPLLAASLGLCGLLAAPAVYAEDPPTFKPPQVGTPDGRVGGGTRGLSRGVEGYARLYALEPGTVGLTLQPQPTLYWAISEAVKEPVELVINHANPESASAMLPLVEAKLGSPGAGIHALNLADYKFSLKPGVEYEWFISVVLDPEKRSKDIITGGAIKLVDPAGAEGACVQEKKASMSLAHAYAQCGLWYDTVAEVSKQIAGNPADQNLRAARVSLLKQVGLPEAAALDK